MLFKLWRFLNNIIIFISSKAPVKKLTLILIFTILFQLTFVGFHHHHCNSFTDPHFTQSEVSITCEICHAFHFDFSLIENLDFHLSLSFAEVETSTLYQNIHSQTNFELKSSRAPPVTN